MRIRLPQPNRCCMRGGILRSSRFPMARCWSSVAVRTKAPLPPRPQKCLRRMGAGGRCGAPRAPRLSGASPETGIIPVPSWRPAAKSSCWATTARCSILDPAGNGTITQLTQQTLAGSYTLPTLAFAPGRLLSVRAQQQVVVVNLSGPQPAITPTANISQLRLWSSGTVLADGKVLVTGGSAVANQLTGVAYAAEIWDPATGQWTLGANAAKPRLYHSIALLLPDGSVLTAGGGAPGPVNNLNAEIYYPPYLYDASGQPAARPSLLSAPAIVQLSLNPQFAAAVGAGDQISRVTLVRTGSVTHSTQPGSALTAAVLHPGWPNVDDHGTEQSKRCSAWLLHVVRLRQDRRALGRKDRSCADLMRRVISVVRRTARDSRMDGMMDKGRPPARTPLRRSGKLRAVSRLLRGSHWTYGTGAQRRGGPVIGGIGDNGGGGAEGPRQRRSPRRDYAG